MILIIDNYDSFTYNLVQLVGEVSSLDVEVHRNDRITARKVQQKKPSHVIISPGPCTPLEAGVSNDVVRRMAGKAPILGVCLGHQCIGHVYGAKVERARRLMHGKTSLVHHDNTGLFEGIENPFTATRYHSLWVRRDTIPAQFEVNAWADKDEVMGMRHRRLLVFGIQFHPESYLTTEGYRLMKAFIATGA